MGNIRITEIRRHMKKRNAGMMVLLLLCLFLSGCGNVRTEDAVDEDIGASTIQTNEEAVSDTAVDKESPDTEDFSDELEFDESSLIKRGDGADNTGSARDGEILEVHFIDIGQGDSILIRQGNSAMLIDAGNNSKGTAVWSYLRSLNVESLDYAVATHPDADHIGGLDVILYKIDCGMIFMPSVKKDTKTYEELMDTIKQRRQTYIVPERGNIYALGNAQFEILTDTGRDYGENVNDYSIALRLVFGNTSFLFTGDAEEAAERDMIEGGQNLLSDVYKASHHGADTANTEEFLTAVNPKYCVISCGQDNTYGHPRAGFLNRLRAMGVKVFRTDEQGTVVAVSDGENITFNTGSSTSWIAGEPMGSEENSGNGHYIINTGTKKFHKPDCSSVKKMSDQNKKESVQSREELIAEGYEPCKNCNP
ncbi:MAG: MBL fold metallo-hydrolase [Lachnospiraceae bacterium]|nr:MBL fold metallo-hydrolase [Lachnospiraceae bacterium]